MNFILYAVILIVYTEACPSSKKEEGKQNRRMLRELYKIENTFDGPLKDEKAFIRGSEYILLEILEMYLSAMQPCQIDLNCDELFKVF